MLRVYFTAVTAALCLFAGFAAHARPMVEGVTPVSVDIAPDRAFVPMGYDDNDNVQIVLDGQLPNTCHKLGETVVSVNQRDHQIFVRQLAYYYTGAWCAEVRIPYAQTVNLGILPAGQYEIFLQHSGTNVLSMGQLSVAVATSQNPDDYLYAPVSEFRLERPKSGVAERDPTLQGTVLLHGLFSTTCMRFAETKVNVRPNNVIEILPIAEMDHAHSNCAQVQREFVHEVPLRGLNPGRYLIHVRSLNGQSLNRIVEF